MLSELECGICYRLFDAGRRCPRLLSCKHRFCESCLLTLAACRSETSQQPGSAIICAFCRQTTPLMKENIQDNLPVDEDILSRLEADGLLGERAIDGEDDEEPRTETNSRTKEDHLLPTQRGRVWRSIKSLYKKLKVPHRRGCITNAEMRDMALMACYMM